MVGGRESGLGGREEVVEWRRRHEGGGRGCEKEMKRGTVFLLDQPTEEEKCKHTVVSTNNEHNAFSLTCTTALLNRPVSSSPLLPSLSLDTLEGATGRTPTAAL